MHDPAVVHKNMRLLANVPQHDVTNSDLAFWGDLAFASSFLGFRIIDISDPADPSVVSEVDCPGAIGDVVVWDDILIRSTTSPQASDACDAAFVTADTPGAWEGVRIFDVSDPVSPEFIGSVAVDCGAHTSTLVPDLSNDRLIVYVSSYPLGATSIGPNCEEPHGYISIVEVPLEAPEDARFLRKEFLDADTTLWDATVGGETFTFTGCHDIAVFTPLDLAAAACFSEGQLWDISRPANPRLLDRVSKQLIAEEGPYYSATFTWDGEVVVFADGFNLGGQPACGDETDARGRYWFHSVPNLRTLGSFEIPREQDGGCTASFGNTVPLRDRDLLVSAWYTGGVSVVDFTDPSDVKEIGYYDDETGEFPSDTWATYWYNGYIYASDGVQRAADDHDQRGLDVLRGPRVTREGDLRLGYLNPQTQQRLLR